MKPRVLDLFSGIGGFSLGLTRAGFRTVAFCEIEEYPQSILRKHWPCVPIFNDVRELRAADITEPVDLICGGYPCQPFSLAGKRKGKDDYRHLWPEIMRIIRELDATTGKPAWGIFENVAGHVSMGLDQVLSDLESEGYTCQTFIIPACAVNAPHRRDRVWIIANHDSAGFQAERAEQQTARFEQYRELGHVLLPNTSRAGQQECTVTTEPDKQRYSHRSSNQDDAANAESQQAEGIFKPWFSANTESGGDLRGQAGEWITLPGVRPRNDGLPNRVARLKALGNAVVPQIPEMIGRIIIDNWHI